MEKGYEGRIPLGGSMIVEPLGGKKSGEDKGSVLTGADLRNTAGGKAGK